MVEVKNSLGVHARPSSLIVQTALKYSSTITLIKDGAVADAKSIMSVMMLAATCGSKVAIQAKGEDEEAAAGAVALLFEQKFNEK